MRRALEIDLVSPARRPCESLLIDQLSVDLATVEDAGRLIAAQTVKLTRFPETKDWDLSFES